MTKKNYKRIVEVWFDDYKEFIYNLQEPLKYAFSL